MTRILLVGEELRYRSFNGANKALPVLASSLARAEFHDVAQLDLEQPGITRELVAAKVASADLVAIAGAMSPQWIDLDRTIAAISKATTGLTKPPPLVVGGYAVKAAEDVLRETPGITAFFDGEGEAGIVALVQAVTR